MSKPKSSTEVFARELAQHGGSVHHATPAGKLTPALAPVPGRSWVYIGEDQLSDQIGPLAELAPSAAAILLVENHWKASLRPYHRQRLALVWANQRHFALEQARRGVAVRYIVAAAPYRTVVAAAARTLGLGPSASVSASAAAASADLVMMTPAEREMREDLLPLIRSKTLRLVRHDGWLTTHDDFLASQQGPPWRMDVFYRAVRKQTGILMEKPSPAPIPPAKGKPSAKAKSKAEAYIGGKLSFDTENRERWDGDPPAPTLPRFEPDAVTAEVIAMIERDFAAHPGVLDAATIPATRQQCEQLWAWAKDNCLEHFGPYEDAMSLRSRNVFHSRISAIMNLHRLLPRQVVQDAEQADIPLASKEGFIRQILGWREFVRHVHIATDGFRILPDYGGPVPVTAAPGDGGFARWAGKQWGADVRQDAAGTKDTALPNLGGAAPAYLAGDQAQPLPPAFWGAKSGLRCLDEVVRSVWEESYSHHITRLMVLSNIATLLDISPRELTDWFWIAYADAWDWVVEPNVLAMSTYGAGEVMTTKPYIAGSAYINKMSDYCGSCRFTPDGDCPLRQLYWAYLERHKDKLQNNPRLMMPMRSLAKRPADSKRADAAEFRRVVKLLVEGKEIPAHRVSRDT
jgi:deoxyribodipyrimidine photolyase-related protein